MELFDNRGLSLFKQDPQQNLFGQTFTATRKVARTWNRLTNNKLSAGKGITFEAVYNIDEERIVYDSAGNAITQTILRNNEVKQTTAAQYNSFNQVSFVGSGDGNFPAYFRYDVKGRLWLNNPGGVNTITMYDLADRITCEVRSANKNLSLSTYVQQGEILGWGINNIQCTEYVRDHKGLVSIEMSPSYYGNGEQASLPIPLSMVVGNQYPTFGATSITWVLPQERNVSAQFIINPLANPNAKQTLPILLNDNCCGVNVAIPALSTDVYQYTINYSLPNPSDPNGAALLTYITQGTLQFNNGNNAQSTAVVVAVTQSNQVVLSGKTAGITQVNLWQGGVSKGSVTVNNNTADLSGQPSGTYTLQPVVNGQVGSMSLPFTIYTSTPSASPLAQEIDCTFQLLTSAQDGQFNWQVPSIYEAQPVQVSINYIDNTNTKRTQAATINPTIINRLDDPTWNMQFQYPVLKIQNISVQLRVQQGATPAQDVWITLAKNLVPLAPSGHEEEFEDDQNEEVAIALKPLSKAKQKEKIVQNVEDILTTNFFPQTIQYIGPFAPFAHTPEHVEFLDTNLDRCAEWAELAVLQASSTTIVLDVTGLAAGFYPFRVAELPDLYFIIGHGSTIYPSNDFLSRTMPKASAFVPGPQVLVHPMKTRTWDAWSNCLTEGDSKNKMTEYEINDFNQTVKKTSPEVNVVGEDGTTTRARPVNSWGFNPRRFLVGETNPNNFTTAHILDAAGQEVQLILADGTTSRTQVFDALTRVMWYLDARNKRWEQSWTRNNQVSQLLSPMKHTTQYTYNEKQERNLVQDAEGHKRYYNYSATHFIEAHYEPGGQETRYVRCRTGDELEVYNPDDTRLFWKRDFFGVPSEYTDAGGAVITYSENFRRQRTHQKSAGGSHGGSFKIIYVYNPRLRRYTTSSTYVPIANQDISFSYRIDQLLSTDDIAQKMRCDYDYTSSNIRISTKIYKGDVLTRSQTSELDELGRLSVCSDTEVITLNFGYDANSNRRFIQCNYGTVNNPLETNAYFTYGPSDLVLIDGGKLENKKIVRGSGTTYTYDQLLRHSETITKAGLAVVTTFTYNDDGLLTKSESTDGSYVMRGFSKTGQPKTYSNNLGEIATFELNENDWQISQSQFSYGLPISNSTYSEFTGAGQSRMQVTLWHAYDKLNQPTVSVQDNLTISYVNFDSPQVDSMIGQRIAAFYNGQIVITDPTTLKQVYTPNGHPETIDGLQGLSKEVKRRVYTTTADGQVLEQANYSSKDNKPYTLTETTRTFVAPSGELLGTYSPTQLKLSKITQSLLTRRYGVSRQGFGLTLGISSQKNQDSIRNFSNNLLPFSHLGPNHTPFEYADPSGRAATYQEHQIGEDKKSIMEITYPLPTPLQYTIMLGDTFSKIASKIYGDESFAQMLADANGMPIDAPLSPQVSYRLRIPPLLISHNNVAVSRPYYQFVQKLMGTIYPYIETPVFKQPEQHPSFWQSLIPAFIEVFAVVVANFIIPGAGTAISPILHGLLVGATAAGLDAVGQGIAVGLGAQDHFSWKETAAVGISAGLFAGTGDVFGTTTKAATATAKQLMLQAGTVAVSQQLAEMAIGIRKNFDIAAIASAILTAGISQKLDKLQPILRTRVSPVLGITLNALLEGGKINVESLAAQALGAMAAQEVGMRLQNTLEAQKQKLASYAKGQKAGQGVGGTSSSNGRGVGNKTNPSQGSRSKSQYKAEPSKKDWANMEFEGWEKASAQQFYDQVESDLKPPEIHWAENPRPPTDEEQVDGFARRKAMLSTPSAPSYKAIAQTFGISLAKSVAAPLIFAEDILENPGKAVVYSQMAVDAVKHPIDTAIAIDRALGQGIVQGVDTLVNGDNISRAALAGSLVGGLGIPFFAKAIGVAGTIKNIGELIPETILTPHEAMNRALQQSQVYELLDNIEASNPNAAIALRNKLSAIAEAQKFADKFEEMPNGATRYYGKFRQAKSEGLSSGARFVTEYNPHNSNLIQFNEVYDQQGVVNRISIKNINGIDIKSNHFPPTLQETLMQNLDNLKIFRSGF